MKVLHILAQKRKSKKKKNECKLQVNVPMRAKFLVVSWLHSPGGGGGGGRHA